MADNSRTSPDMVKFESVIAIITDCPKAFASEKDMAMIIRQINNLQKYDLKPVADNVNNLTVNVIAETSRVKKFLEDLDKSIRRSQ
jgi:hypothetical protein